MNADLMVAAATFALVLVTVWLAIVTLNGVRDQMWLTTFAEYTSRYSDIMDDLPFDARRAGSNFSLDALPVDERNRTLTAIRKYLNLCSEEHYLHSKGKIDKDTWGIWVVGIRDTMRLSCFQQGWRDLSSEYEYYPDFVTFMETAVSGSESNG